MASAENSYVGFAKQSAKGTPATTGFGYFSFSRGGIGPQNQYISPDQEIGTGGLPTDLEKGGVFSAGAFEFTPHAHNIGHWLTGVLGESAAPVADGTGYKHTITMKTDVFDTPYYTFHSKPGNLWGEEFDDCRIAALTLSWKAADYVRAQAAVIGLAAAGGSVLTAAAPDVKPTFIAPVSVITGLGETLKVLRGSVSFGAQIPMDEQWITGAYYPDGVDITARQIGISLLLKISDATLYNKMQYDPAGGSAWLAGIFKDDIEVDFYSSQTYDTGKKYGIKIIPDAATIAWTAQPISLQAGKIVTMLANGVVLKPSGSTEPVVVELYNDTSTQY